MTELPVLPPSLDLSGRVALVTGAGSPLGIGMATARLLGSLGAHVVITSTTERVLERLDELRAAGVGADGSIVDLTDPESVDVLVAGIISRLGRVDVVVNNAGMTSAHRPADIPGAAESGLALDLDVDRWRASLARNLDSAFLVARAALAPMIDAGWGRIVNVASLTGPVMAMRREPAYAAAKAGMVGLTRALAIDHARHGITVNAVAPGWIATGSQTPDEHEQGLRTPVGRSGTAAETASAIAWLASPGAAYVTGQCIVVDGGNSVAEERGPWA